MYKVIGDKIKNLEKRYEHEIPPYKSFIIRLDGKNFSTFTKNFNKPFDERFFEAMLLTMNDLIEKFNASTGYTHSDEITLIFNKACTIMEWRNKTNKTVHMFNGRTMKLATVISGYCSVRFSYHILGCVALNPDKNSESLIQKVSNPEMCFDARIFSCSPKEIVEHMRWRSTFDCARNCVQSYARQFYSAKELHGKKCREMIKMMKLKGFDWIKDCPSFHKYGVYGKKILYEKEVEVNGKKEKCIRSGVIKKMFRIEQTKEMENLMLEKYWPEDSKNYSGIWL